MQRTQHSSNNAVLGAPQGWDQAELPCDALPVTRMRAQDGQQVMVSFWRPSSEELDTLRRGGLVALVVYGEIHPPVALSVEQ